MREGVEVMRFKVGGKVRVRENLIVGKAYGEQEFVEGMEKYRGKVMEVDGDWNTGCHLKGDKENWAFSDEMLEPIEDPLAQKILERNNKRSIQDRLPEELEKILAYEPHDPIKPEHYNKGEIDLFESAYRTRPFNEFRAIMEFVAERYMKRDKNERVEDINKAMETLRRLKEYEEKEREKNG